MTKAELVDEDGRQTALTRKYSEVIVDAVFSSSSKPCSRATRSSCGASAASARAAGAAAPAAIPRRAWGCTSRPRRCPTSSPARSCGLREGDKKTPLGVYHVTGQLPRKKLTDFYGAGAWPLNYPNEWDRREGRAGHGIWLHATPRDTYSRPPRASDGCLVLSNEDLTSLARQLQPGLTPVVIASNIEWVMPNDLAALRRTLAEQVERWR